MTYDERRGAPLASSKTSNARETSPCGQKSDSSGKLSPSASAKARSE